MLKPERLLTPREAAEYLRLNPRTVVRLAREGRIPAVKAGNRWRFRIAALAGWVGTSDSESPEHAKGVFSLTSHVSMLPLLRPDLVLCDLQAADHRAALAEITAQLAQGGYLGRPEEFLALLLERESLMSTRLVEGVAVPHPRRAVPGMFTESLVTVAISGRGVDFGGADGRTVKVLFVICASDDRTHLRILARLSRLLRETPLYRTLLSAATPEEVIEVVRMAEKALPDEKDAAAG